MLKDEPVTVVPLPAKLLIRSPLAPDCDFELRVSRDLTSEEWDSLEEYIAICRRGATRRRPNTAELAAAEDKMLAASGLESYAEMLSKEDQP